jgi:hypothetical protein
MCIIDTIQIVKIEQMHDIFNEQQANDNLTSAHMLSQNKSVEWSTG